MTAAALQETLQSGRVMLILYFENGEDTRVENGQMKFEDVLALGHKAGAMVAMDAAARIPPASNLSRFAKLGAVRRHSFLAHHASALLQLLNHARLIFTYRMSARMSDCSLLIHNTTNLVGRRPCVAYVCEATWVPVAGIRLTPISLGSYLILSFRID